MRVLIEEDYHLMSMWAAKYIASQIRHAMEDGKKPYVLGLPTGSTPLGTYQELIKLHKAGSVSFSDVVTFNMDEYVGLPAAHPESYHSFMKNNFFSQIDIREENIHILNGMAEDLEQECRNYEDEIASYGGIDLFLGGIGADGHIAFNEPFSSLSSHTRVKDLTYDTKVMNSRFFGNDVSKVPSQALTVGVQTVCNARTVVLLVNGHAKAKALQGCVEGPVTQYCTASALQMHPHALVVCDESACDELKVGTYRYFKDIEAANLDAESIR
ncbi:MAG: glucosamine-6-phosphate deaminase [Spirochaetia bacterium]|nr:glucosamine-6-phosphate deaminase [Spirochaetia bacterium]